MTLVYTRTPGGLEVASHGADEASVARALKDHDPDLRLVLQPLDDGILIYEVRLFRGYDRPSEHVLSWMSDRGEPWPLTMQIVEHVKHLDRNSRQPYLSPEERDAEKRRCEAKDWEDSVEAIVDDWKEREGRSACLPRSQSLRMARDKARARGEKI